uniref:GAG-pre-integrase domain-containing protein n=1 Tax=Nicotiana tabacum TaxID=4097 RepID=A0A1S4DMQ1_TOBAC|nr:PREDICTED: uncharacterized protein LOC107831444 [Nicotiana tabacum]
MEVVQFNVEAQNLIYNAISGEEYEKISSCDTTKEMWDKLKVGYEGTSKVKETQINMLVHDYELFRMKEGESIEEVFERSSKIIGDLKTFGKLYSSGDQEEKKKIVAFKDTTEGHENDIDDDPEALEEEIAMILWLLADEDASDDECTEDTENCFMARGETSKDILDLTLKESQKMLNELRRLNGENKVWELKLEVCEIDRDVLQDEVQEFQMQLNGMRKSTSHSSVKSNQETYKSTEKELARTESTRTPQKESQRKWYLDSVCSSHMTDDKNLLKEVTKINGGNVKFGDDTRGKIVDTGTVPISNNCDITKVHLVDRLNYNLLSIIQLCDLGYKVKFKKTRCVIENEAGKIILPGKRYGNIYILNGFENLDSHICLASISDDPWLWHKKLGHASMHLIEKLSKHDLVIGLPKLNFSRNHVCDACQIGKQTKNSFKTKDIVSTFKPLQLIHMDLFGPTRTTSIRGKRYAFVIVDYYPRFAWVIFLSHKDEH